MISKIVSIIGKPKGLEINSMVPTLVTSNATLSISSAASDKSELVITNFQGIVVTRRSLSLSKGNIDAAINLSILAKGNYILSIRTAKIN